jgi:hypothetical protein
MIDEPVAIFGHVVSKHVRVFAGQRRGKGTLHHIGELFIKGDHDRYVTVAVRFRPYDGH